MIVKATTCALEVRPEASGVPGTLSRWVPIAALVLITLCARNAGSETPAQQPPDPSDLTGMSLDQLLDAEVVYAASRRIQTLREAPSAVSVVTAAEIRAHGYRTIADVLRSLPSFYVTEDRRYSFVGVRGFNRPGDYGARILLLLNGLRTNDALYEQAYVGQEFLVDIDLVERIEVVRGPSAAIYGNSAFFAVVNVVTRRGRDFQGGELSGAASSFGTRTAAARPTGGAWTAASSSSFPPPCPTAAASGSTSRITTHPSTANGIADRIDGERFDAPPGQPFQGRLIFRGEPRLTRQGDPHRGLRHRSSATPRTRTTDAKDLVSLTYARSRPDRSSMMARVHYGRLDYHGTYAFATRRPASTTTRRAGEWYGLEASVVRPLGARHLRHGRGSSSRTTSTCASSISRWSRGSSTRTRTTEAGARAVFGQDEITLSTRLSSTSESARTGTRAFGQQTSPRAGPRLRRQQGHDAQAPRTAAPSAPPTSSSSTSRRRRTRLNPGLGPETIHTAELVLERILPYGLHLNASALPQPRSTT